MPTYEIWYWFDSENHVKLKPLQFEAPIHLWEYVSIGQNPGELEGIEGKVLEIHHNHNGSKNLSTTLIVSEDETHPYICCEKESVKEAIRCVRKSLKHLIKEESYQVFNKK